MIFQTEKQMQFQDSLEVGIVQALFKRLGGGNCSGFIQKEKQRSAEQYRLLMKECEKESKKVQELELQLSRMRKELQRLQKTDLEGQNKKQRISVEKQNQQLSELGGEVSDIQIISESKVDQNKVSNFGKENQYSGDEDLMRVGRQIQQTRKNKKLTFLKESQKNQCSVSFYTSLPAKVKRSHQGKIDIFFKTKEN
eukprot:TRINITY_DN3048_c0_g1_i2.p3 TRINITY_DN3048_c0_g1~~TRINITY_DN3048_c0_g1_i2.p3  ORF type:complete len:196 (-),score=18.25 TRINITY_DN3048_c0_g1_i2:15-602(-)